jgi:hypothetical protein
MLWCVPNNLWKTHKLEPGSELSCVEYSSPYCIIKLLHEMNKKHLIFELLWKEKLNGGGQQFHQYHHSERFDWQNV